MWGLNVRIKRQGGSQRPVIQRYLKSNRTWKVVPTGGGWYKDKDIRLTRISEALEDSTNGIKDQSTEINRKNLSKYRQKDTQITDVYRIPSSHDQKRTFSLSW